MYAPGVAAALWLGVAAVSLGMARTAAGQMPGAPVLQNAWAAPGTVFALDFAGGRGTSVYALAGGWTGSGGRFQFSGGLGLQSVSGTSARSRFVYGARLAMPIMQAMEGKLGVAGFAGVGGGSSRSANARDSLQSNFIVPAGIGVGYRQAIGTSGRGFSVYLDPQYQYRSRHAGGLSAFHVAYGLDVGLTPRWGITVGGESGSGDDTGAVWGLGISMKFGR